VANLRASCRAESGEEGGERVGGRGGGGVLRQKVTRREGKRDNAFITPDGAHPFAAKHVLPSTEGVKEGRGRGSAVALLSFGGPPGVLYSEGVLSTFSPTTALRFRWSFALFCPLDEGSFEREEGRGAVVLLSRA